MGVLQQCYSSSSNGNLGYFTMTWFMARLSSTSAIGLPKLVGLSWWPFLNVAELIMDYRKSPDIVVISFRSF
jgi:hypothetical protein